MFKRIGFLLIILSIAVFHFSVQPISALSLIEPAPPTSSSSLLFGQQQIYTVTYRGNGEAVVLAKVIFSNQTDSPLSELTLRVPKGQINDYVAFQVFVDRQCARYESSVCIQYRDPDFQYPSGNASYQRANVNLEGDTLTITLPQTVGQTFSGSILLSYRALGYARKNLVGTYEYAFETLKTPEAVTEVIVGISTDSDLYLKGAKGKVNYQMSMDVASVNEIGMGAPATANSRFDQIYRQIGYGSIQKKASNLKSLESYTVKGSYADSNLKLYAKETLIGIAVALVFLILILLVSRWILRSINPPAPSANVSAQKNVWLIITGGSFIASLIIVGYTVLLIWVVQFIPRYQSQFALPILLLFFVISIGLYGLLLLGPGIYVGIRKGLGFGLAMIGSTIFWLVIYAFAYMLAVSAFNSPIRDDFGVTRISAPAESEPVAQ